MNGSEAQGQEAARAALLARARARFQTANAPLARATIALPVRTRATRILGPAGAGQPPTRLGAGHEVVVLRGPGAEVAGLGRGAVTLCLRVRLEPAFASVPRVFIVAPRGGTVSLRAADITPGGFAVAVALDRNWTGREASFDWMAIVEALP